MIFRYLFGIFIYECLIHLVLAPSCCSKHLIISQNSCGQELKSHHTRSRFKACLWSTFNDEQENDYIPLAWKFLYDI